MKEASEFQSSQRVFHRWDSLRRMLKGLVVKTIWQLIGAKGKVHPYRAFAFAPYSIVFYFAASDHDE